MIEIMLDHFARQLPDIDPTETKEWIDSLDAVVAAQGTPRARYIMAKLRLLAPSFRCDGSILFS